MVEVYSASLVEQNVGRARHNLILLGALAHLMVVELVPLAAVERVGRVVARAQLALVIRDGEEVVEGPVRRPFTTHNELRHVQAILREVDEGVLLGMAAAEALQVDDEDGWHVVHLDLLDGLLVVQAPLTVPGVRLRQLLRPVELPEAVVDADAFGEFLAGVGLAQAPELRILVVDEAIEARVERPALLVIELDQELELEIVTLLLVARSHRGTADALLRTGLRSAALAGLPSLFGPLFVLLRCLGLLGIRGLRWLPIFLVEEVGLRGDASLVQDLPQRDFIVKLQWTAFALHAVAVDAGYRASRSRGASFTRSSSLLSGLWAILGGSLPTFSCDDADVVGHILEFLSAWVRNLAAEDCLVLLAQTHLLPPVGAHARWDRHSTPLHVRLVVAWISIDALARL